MSDNLPERVGGGPVYSEAPTWAEMLGPCCRRADLPTELAENAGLMWMATSDGLEVCPDKQFALSPTGQRDLVPLLASAWVLFRDLDEQRGDGRDTTMLRFVAPYRDDGASLFDKLTDMHRTPEEKLGILSKQLEQALHAAAWEGTRIQDPRTRLGWSSD
jgi:hypothetical protein